MELSHANQLVYQWGPFELNDEATEAHFLGLGTTGSGKTLLLRLLQQSVLPYVGAGLGIRALVYDAKQDAMPILYGYCDPSRIKLLNPFDERGVAWDIAKDVARSAVAMQTAFTLIPEVADSTPFFRNAARHITWGTMSSFTLSRLDWTFADLLRGLRSEDICRRIIARHQQTEHLIPKYFRDPKLINDIFATLAQACMLYEPIAASWEIASEKVSLREAAQNEYIYVLGNKEDCREPIDLLNSVLFRIWTDTILSQPDGTSMRFWSFIDELSEAGYLSGLVSFLKKARSKGGRCVVCCQSLEGLKSDKMYKDKPTADLLSCFGNRFVARLECPETAEYCSKYIGDQEILQSSHSASSSGTNRQSSVSYAKAIQRTILPSEFMNIPACGADNGLTSLYKMRSTQPCWDTISPDELFNESITPKAPGVDEFIPRPAMSEYLNPWTTAQLAHFAPEGGRSSRNPLEDPDLDI